MTTLAEFHGWQTLNDDPLPDPQLRELYGRRALLHRRIVNTMSLHLCPCPSHCDLTEGPRAHLLVPPFALSMCLECMSSFPFNLTDGLESGIAIMQIALGIWSTAGDMFALDTVRQKCAGLTVAMKSTHTLPRLRAEDVERFQALGVEWMRAQAKVVG